MSKIEILPIFPSFKASDIVKEKREEFKAKTKETLTRADKNRRVLIPYVAEFVHHLVEVHNELTGDMANFDMCFHRALKHITEDGASFNCKAYEIFGQGPYDDGTYEKTHAIIWLNSRRGAHVHNPKLQYSCCYGGDYRRDIKGMIENAITKLMK